MEETWTSGFDFAGAKRLFALIWDTAFDGDFVLPIINLTPAHFILSLLVLFFLLRMLSSLIGFGSGAISYNAASGFRELQKKGRSKK